MELKIKLYFSILILCTKENDNKIHNKVMKRQMILVVVKTILFVTNKENN